MPDLVLKAKICGLGLEAHGLGLGIVQCGLVNITGSSCSTYS